MALTDSDFELLKDGFADACVRGGDARLRAAFPAERLEALSLPRRWELLELATRSLSLTAARLVAPQPDAALLNHGAKCLISLALGRLAGRPPPLPLPGGGKIPKPGAAPHIVSLLLELGADPMGRAGQDRSPLGRSLRMDPVIRLALLNHGAKPIVDDLRLAIDWELPMELGQLLEAMAPRSRILAELVEHCESHGRGDCLRVIGSHREARALRSSLRRSAPPSSGPRRM